MTRRAGTAQRTYQAGRKANGFPSAIGSALPPRGLSLPSMPLIPPMPVMGPMAASCVNGGALPTPNPSEPGNIPPGPMTERPPI